jgi:hypothetical protein
MTKLDEHANKLRPGLLDETGRLAREAWDDIGTTYQQILLQNASVRPPVTVSSTNITTQISQDAGRADVAPVVRPPEPELDR